MTNLKTKHQNNFDFLRLLFSIFVLITHAYPLTGESEIDYLNFITYNKISFSHIALSGFFTISGFLIFRSLFKSKNLLDYFLKRILRIFPALIAVLIISSITGFVFTNYNFIDYFSQGEVYSYVYNNLLLFFKDPQYNILDVFKGNPLHAVNGSIWSLSYEFFFYFVIACLWIIRRRITLVKVIVILSFLLLIIFKFLLSGNGHQQIHNLTGMNAQLKKEYTLPFTALLFSLFIRWGLFFIAGCILSFFNFNFKLQIIIVIISTLLISITLRSNFFDYLQYVLLPLIYINFGLLNTPVLAGLNSKIGDWSYGIYLWGFPIQQVLVYYFKLNYLNLIFLSIPLSIFFGFLSWNLIEKHALKMKTHHILIRKNFWKKQRYTSLP